MQFSKLIVGSLLALASSVASQVVVTVTNTVTVITITVTPLTTSTYTQFTTISSAPPTTTRPSTRTITSTVTYTSTPPETSATAITTCPIPLYYQCGGSGWSGCTSCVAGATCLSQNQFYSQCTTHVPSVVTLTSTIYRG